MIETAIAAVLILGALIALAGFLWPERRPDMSAPAEQPDPRLAAEARDLNETRGF